jgi:hypothetical protein
MTHSRRRRSSRRIRRNVDRRGKRGPDTSAKLMREWLDLRQRLDDAQQEGPRRSLQAPEA